MKTNETIQRRVEGARTPADAMREQFIEIVSRLSPEDLQRALAIGRRLQAKGNPDEPA